MTLRASQIGDRPASLRKICQFLPGDDGPDGQIVDHWFAIKVVGTVSYVVDGTTFATSDISIQGRYTDICAAIS